MTLPQADGIFQSSAPASSSKVAVRIGGRRFWLWRAATTRAAKPPTGVTSKSCSTSHSAAPRHPRGYLQSEESGLSSCYLQIAGGVTITAGHSECPRNERGWRPAKAGRSLATFLEVG